MDCYPDAAERFGELPPGGRGQPGAPAPQPLAVPPRRGGRRARRRHGRAAPHAVRAPAGDRPRFEVIPNWERLEQFPDVAGRARGTGYDVAAASTAARSCSTSATPGSATASARCSTPPPQLARRGALPVRRRRCPVGRPRAGGGRRRADQRGAARLRAQGRHARGDGRRRPRAHHARRPQPRRDEPVEAARQPRRRPAGPLRRPGGQQRRRGDPAPRRRAAASATATSKGFVAAVRALAADDAGPSRAPDRPSRRTTATRPPSRPSTACSTADR